MHNNRGDKMKTLKRIINNVPVTILKTNKFKSVAGKLYFKSPITKEKMSYRLILRNILMESCKKYDTEEKLYKKSLENYDAYYSASSSRIGIPSSSALANLLPASSPARR